MSSSLHQKEKLDISLPQRMRTPFLFIAFLLFPSFYYPSVVADDKDASPASIIPGKIVLRLPSAKSQRDADTRADEVHSFVKRFHPGLQRRHMRMRGLFPGRKQRAQDSDKEQVTTHFLVEFQEIGKGEEGRQKTRQLIDLLRQSGYEASPDYLVKGSSLNDPALPPSSGTCSPGLLDLWGLEKINAASAWSISQGAGQVVAVIDTGVDFNHPDLAGKVSFGPNYIGTNEYPIDDNGHGTHVAGTIAAIGNNGIGIVGVAPEAKILAIKVLGSDGVGSLTDCAEAVRYAADHGATVINMSLGGNVVKGYEPTYLADAIEYAHARGVVLAVSAGNDHQDALLKTPANDPNVITVASTDSIDLIARYSNYGYKIAVAAPGNSIFSLWPSPFDSITKTHPWGVRYACLSGTSMATPHVAGVAALVRAQYPAWSPEQVRQAIQVGSDKVAFRNFDPFRAGDFDPYGYGYGRLNAVGALQRRDLIGVQLMSVPLEVTTTLITVYGTVEKENLKNWSLQVGYDSNPTKWITLLSGTTSFTNAPLVVNLSPAPLTTTILRLVAKNQADQSFESRADLNMHLPSPDLSCRYAFVGSGTGNTACGKDACMAVTAGSGTMDLYCSTPAGTRSSIYGPFYARCCHVEDLSWKVGDPGYLQPSGLVAWEAGVPYYSTGAAVCGASNAKSGLVVAGSGLRAIYQGSRPIDADPTVSQLWNARCVRQETPRAGYPLKMNLLPVPAGATGDQVCQNAGMQCIHQLITTGLMTYYCSTRALPNVPVYVTCMGF